MLQHLPSKSNLSLIIVNFFLTLDGAILLTSYDGKLIISLLLIFNKVYLLISQILFFLCFLYIYYIDLILASLIAILTDSE